MSSRQSTGRGGRGARYNNRHGGRGAKNNTNANKKKEHKFRLFNHDGQMNESFDEVYKRLILIMQKKDLDKKKDVLTSLYARQGFDFNDTKVKPKLKFSTATKEDQKVIEDANLQRSYEIEMKTWEKRKDTFDDNMITFHGTILNDFCTEKMRAKIEREADYQTTLSMDPFKLLLRIEQFMTRGEESEYEIFAMMEAINGVARTRQKEDEDNESYRRRFEQHVNKFQTLLGDDALNAFITKTKGYDESRDKKQYKEDGWELFKAGAYLYNADRSRYGPRINTMNDKFALIHQSYEQRCEYPTTIDNAQTVLNRTKIPSKKQREAAKQGSQSKSKNSNSNSNENSNVIGVNMAQTQGNQGGAKCYVCGDPTHKSNKCEHRFRPQAEWFRPDKYVNYGATSEGRQFLQSQTSGRSGEDSVEQSSVRSDSGSQAGATRGSNLMLVPATATQRRGQYVQVQGLNLMQIPMEHQDDEASEVSFVQIDYGFLQSPMPTQDSTPEEWQTHHDEMHNARYYFVSQANKKEKTQDRPSHLPISLKNKLILDSGSTFHMYCNKNLFKPGSIRRMATPFYYMGNTGERVIELEGLDYGGVLEEYIPFDPQGMANVLSVALLRAADFIIEYDSENNQFVVTNADRNRRTFFNEDSGLYTWDVINNRNEYQDWQGPYNEFEDDEENPHLRFEEAYENERADKYVRSIFKYSALQDHKKHVEGFTKQQVDRATKARAAYHTAGAPDMKLFKLAVRGGFFKNFPLNESDIVNADKIYGPSASVYKGKTKRPTPKKRNDDWISIPEELILPNQKLDLAIDIAFINNAVIFTSIDKAIRFRQALPLKRRTKDDLYAGIDKVLRIYNHAGFRVRNILCDAEFRSVFDEVKDEMDVNMIYAAPGEHEPTAERNNQHLKSLFRVHFHRMYFKAIPKRLTEALAKRVADTTNYYPAKGGVSTHYSPHMIIHKRGVNFAQECVAEIGSYVQGYGHETNRTQKTRTIDGIYCGPADHTQGGHIIWDLNTDAEVVRSKVKVLPMTSQIIRLVETKAHDEGVMDLRTYSRRNGEIILDGDLLAGVDPQELWSNLDDEDYDPQTENEPQYWYDETLPKRSQTIPDEEIEDLLEDYDDHLEDYEQNQRYNKRRKHHNDDDSEDDELFIRLEERTKSKESDQNHQSDEEDMDAAIEQATADQQFEHMITELQDQEDPEDKEEYRSENYIEELNDAEEQDIEEQENDEQESTTRRTRSGKAFFQDGIKYRPTERNNRNRPRYYQMYHNVKKRKANSKKNRSAIRRKARHLDNKQTLKRRVKAKELVRRKKTVSKSELESLHNLAFQQIGSENKGFYEEDDALLIARFMHEITEKIKNDAGKNFIQQYYLTKGLKIFGEDGKKAAMKELEQLVQRNCWCPISVKELTQQEKERAVEAMMLLAQKNSGEHKGRCVYKGNETREWLTREDTASPTASLEAINATCVIDAYEERDVMTVDIPNAFIQTPMPEGEEKVIMKITGLLVKYLVEIEPSYRDYIVYENGKKVIYVKILRAIYGMLQASLLWYTKLRTDLENYGFEFNPYDPCIANKIVNGKQQTIRFHVDDLMSSHIDPKVNDEFYAWMDNTYGKLKKVTCTRGPIHEYLGMTIDFSKKKKVKIRMDAYVKRMLDEFPIKFDANDKQETPAGPSLLEPGKGAKLDLERKEIFHSFVAKSLFLSKRARLDINPTVTILASRVQSPTIGDWKKLVRLMKYIHCTQGWHLTLSADNIRVIKWYVDASFAVHPDFKSHTGAVMTMGKGAMQIMSRKQKLNSRSSTEAEIIGVDDAATAILWTRLFMEAQGYPVDKNILYQDNKSSILLETNGRNSAGKRSRAINIRFFFMTDQVEKGNVSIEYMPTDDMWADFMTKPLQGEKFRKFRDFIQGEQD